MKKIIVIVVMLLIGLVANAQLNVKKVDDSPKTLTTLLAYCSYLKQDANGYHIVTKSYNQYDEMDYWFNIGANKEECLSSIDNLMEILQGSTEETYTVKDSMGEDLTMFVKKGLSRIIVINDVGHRYAGHGELDMIVLKKAKKWCEEHL